ncbi:MAG TPA: SH3 domain-containing protein [Candidatus Ozemobacteraceae bacterium]|nr:SH3 domain-containing protein [Candidatus Ozemobacteraceae bacterium]
MLRTGFLQNTALMIMTIAILIFCPLAEAEEQIYQYGKFAAGAKFYLFADKVNLRAAPSTSGRVVGNLPVGTELKTLDEPYGEFSMSGFAAPWYRVQSVSQPEVQGHIWGGLLSLASINFEDSGKKLTLVSGITGFGEFNFAGECRVISEGQIIARAPFKWIATMMGQEKNYGYNVRIDELSWKGTQDIKKVFQINCGYDACGYTRGNILFFWTGREILTGPTAEEVSEAGVFHVESVFVFPGDEGLGEKSLLLRTTTNEEADSENGVAASAKKVETLYTWNGKAWEAGSPVETVLTPVSENSGNNESVESAKNGDEGREDAAGSADDTEN